jgi:hypothetical protein
MATDMEKSPAAEFYDIPVSTSPEARERHLFSLSIFLCLTLGLNNNKKKTQLK